MNIRLTQLDGNLPNLALMKLAHYHNVAGDTVYLAHTPQRGLFEPQYDIIYGSAIFNFSKAKLEHFKRNFPNAILGGTGTESQVTVEEIIGIPRYELYDYNLYPEYQNSIGFSQRGCRLKCPFCVVPKKEGANYSINSIADIWRGEPYPKNIVLLDNDFFGQELWRERSEEIIEGNYKISFNQGINIRLFDKEQAKYLSKMRYSDYKFTTKRIYTAWDNRKDESRFFRGIKMLLDTGVKSSHIMVYMLCGYWKNETFDDVYYRFERMREIGLRPYPMVYDKTHKLLRMFQRWVIRRYYEFVSFDEYTQIPAHNLSGRKLSALRYKI